jgi:hypothetical protein
LFNLTKYEQVTIGLSLHQNIIIVPKKKKKKSLSNDFNLTPNLISLILLIFNDDKVWSRFYLDYIYTGYISFSKNGYCVLSKIIL